MSRVLFIFPFFVGLSAAVFGIELQRLLISGEEAGAFFQSLCSLVVIADLRMNAVQCVVSLVFCQKALAAAPAAVVYQVDFFFVKVDFFGGGLWLFQFFVNASNPFRTDLPFDFFGIVWSRKRILFVFEHTVEQAHFVDGLGVFVQFVAKMLITAEMVNLFHFADGKPEVFVVANRQSAGVRRWRVLRFPGAGRQFEQCPGGIRKSGIRGTVRPCG